MMIIPDDLCEYTARMPIRHNDSDGEEDSPGSRNGSVIRNYNHPAGRALTKIKF